MIRAGGFPISTLGTFGFEDAGTGSGVSQALLSSAEDQGSNMARLFCEATGGSRGGAAGFGGATGGAERLNVEFRLDETVGDDTLVGGGTGGWSAGDVNESKSSSANKSRDADASGFDVMAEG